MNRLTRLLGAFALLLCLFPTLSRADGFIIIREPSQTVRVPGHFAFAPLQVTYHRVSVEINDQVAVTTVDQEFYNPNPQRLEGTYIFPLPPGAHIDKFSMDVNGRMQDAELIDSDKARSIYEEIVRKYRDPALLEYAGRDAFKARIFPIEPNSRKPIKIKYTQLLKSDSGLTEYTYPLNTEKFSATPLGDVSVKVTLACKEPVKAVYCPSHQVEIRRDGDRKATIGYEQRNVRPDTDFKLIFSRTPKPLGVDLLTYRNGPDDGYFLLLAAPGASGSSKDAIQPKDVCFVIDTSGSMAEHDGKKMEQAKRALSFCLQNLNEGDRFNIVRFSTEAEAFFDALTPAAKANVDKAIAYVQTLKPIGGTAIDDALRKALSLRPPPAAAVGQSHDGRGPGPDRPYLVIFLTDGQPTIGETNEDKIVHTVWDTSGAGQSYAPGATVRVFSFGIGTDVNTHLLDRIASQTKAFSQYVLPQEDLEVKLSNFYTKVKEPALTDVQVAFTGEGVRATQVYPGTMPDLFKGDMLVAFGRYTGKGPSAVRISGTIGGERREFVTDVNFTEQDTANEFIPRLWATRRVGWLLDEIRLRGESKELKDEVVKLARQHGIVTPYTSYLIVEDEARRNVPVALRTQRELEGDTAARGLARYRYDSAKREAEDQTQRAGLDAVANAKDLYELKSSTNLQQVREQGEQLAKGQNAPRPESAAGAYGGAIAGRRPLAAAAEPAQLAAGVPTTQPAGGYKESQNYAQQARVVNGRAFYQNGKTWTDATAQTQANLKQKQIAFNSDDYFALLKKHPDAAPWLALGEEVDVVIGDTLYQVRPGA